MAKTLLSEINLMTKVQKVPWVKWLYFSFMLTFPPKVCFSFIHSFSTLMSESNADKKKL